MASDHIRHLLAQSLAAAPVETGRKHREDGDEVTRPFIFRRSRWSIVQTHDANLASLKVCLDVAITESRQSITELHQDEIDPALFRQPNDAAQPPPFCVNPGGVLRDHVDDAGAPFLRRVEQALLLPIPLPVPLLLEGGHARIDHSPVAAAARSGSAVDGFQTNHPSAPWASNGWDHTWRIPPPQRAGGHPQPPPCFRNANTIFHGTIIPGLAY